MSSGYDTPMMRQHSEIKEKYPDAYLFFRCGDFYELFGNDAIEAVKILNIALTKRQNEIPMCGVPYHAADTYISRMIKAGKKVALVEQMEDPKQAKGLVRRAVTEIITPGTVVEEKHLSQKQNNFLVSILLNGIYFEVAGIDISTGEFETSRFSYSQNLVELKSWLYTIRPREVLIAEDVWDDYPTIRELIAEKNILVNRFPLWFFNDEENVNLIFETLKIKSLNELGIPKDYISGAAAGSLLHYLKNNFHGDFSHIRNLRFSSGEGIMSLDESTIRNLELIYNQQDGTGVNSLFEVLDKTKTSMGARLLKKWIVSPLTEKKEIDKRLDIVDFLYRNAHLRNFIGESIKKIMDLERFTSRLVGDKAGPKDLIGLKNSLNECFLLKEELEKHDKLSFLLKDLDPQVDVFELINKAIKDEPATFLEEGNIIRNGYNSELDELKKIALDGKEYILSKESKWRELYGVPSLKIKYNKIIGYFFEVSKMQSVNLGEDFILRQSLVNVTRYTNKELSEFESKIVTARDSMYNMEKELFYEVRKAVLDVVDVLQNNAKVIAQLDVYYSFAEISFSNIYVRPEIIDGYDLIIEEGRHPVVETKLDYNKFIPNDSSITREDFIMIITGPNMAGKSTYLRQNALIVLMAQIGCFVPASNAKIGVVDRIFTRIGSSDNLSRGESTFFVEMSETAYILNNATGKSLIIMDEIGRGTSTHDGLAIAWSILEFISNTSRNGAKTLFATHYHELTTLDSKKGFKNLSVAVAEKDGVFVFLHKIISQCAEKSYGVYVAQLAGLPLEVVHYAAHILENLENKQKEVIPEDFKTIETDLFGFTEEKKENSKYNEIINSISYIDLDRVTPIQGLQILYDMQKKLKDKKNN